MKKFAEMIAKEINDNRDGYNSQTLEVVKINDEKLVGVIVRKDGNNGGCVNYIDEDLMKNASVMECADMFIRNVKVDKDVELAKKEFEWNDVKNLITMRLVNTEYNTEFLADKVHKDLGNGLSMMFDITTDEYNAAITTALADKLGIDELMLVCASQISDAGTPILYDMAEALFVNEPTNFLEGDVTSHSSMLVLKTRDKFGASAIYRGGVAEKIKKVVGDYYLLPSSVCEWIVVPKSSGIEVDALKDMVYEANRTVVDKCDLLSDGVYEWAEDGVKRIA